MMMAHLKRSKAVVLLAAVCLAPSLAAFPYITDARTTFNLAVRGSFIYTYRSFLCRVLGC